MKEIFDYNMKITNDYIEILDETSFTLEKSKLEWSEIKNIGIHSEGLYSPAYITIFLKNEEQERGKIIRRTIKNIFFINKKKGNEIISFFENIKNSFPEKEVVKNINMKDIRERVFLVRINFILIFSLLSFSILTPVILILSKQIG